MNRNLVKLLEDKGFTIQVISLMRGRVWLLPRLMNRFFILRVIYYFLRLIITNTQGKRVIVVHPCLSVLVASVVLKNLKSGSFVFYLHDTIEPAYRHSQWSYLAQYCEKRLRAVQNVDLWYISEGLQNLYVNRGFIRGSIIPHIYNLNLHSHQIDAHCQGSDYVVFPGSIYAINEHALNRAIKIFSQINVKVVLTQRPSVALSGEGMKIVKIVEDLSFMEYLSLLKGSLANLILLSDSSESSIAFEELSTIFPTKLIDYLLVNRPIVYLASGEYFVVKWLERRKIGFPLTEDLTLKILEMKGKEPIDYSEHLELFKANNIGKNIFR